MKKRLIAIVFVLIAAFGVLCYGSRYRRQKTPAVSVVMLTYQRAEMLPQAIESILSQTFSDFEFIIINDGSSDNTDEVVARCDDPRVRYYRNDRNRGIAFSRNRAAALARGKYVMIMDDDDKSLPTRMGAQVSFLESHPEIAAVAGQIKGLPRIPQNHDEIAAGLIQYNNFGNANVMYRRDFAAKHNIRYDEGLKASEDWDFWLQILFAGGKLAALPDDVLERNGASTKYYGISYEEANAAVRKKIGKAFLPEKPDAFYAADSCGKLKLISEKNIFSPVFTQKLFDINCPAAASPAVR